MELLEEYVRNYRTKRSNSAPKDQLGQSFQRPSLIPDDIRLFREQLRKKWNDDAISLSRGKHIIHDQYGEGIIVGRNYNSGTVWIRFFDAEREIAEQEAREKLIDYPSSNR